MTSRIERSSSTTSTRCLIGQLTPKSYHRFLGRVSETVRYIPIAAARDSGLHSIVGRVPTTFVLLELPYGDAHLHADEHERRERHDQLRESHDRIYEARMMPGRHRIRDENGFRDHDDDETNDERDRIHGKPFVRFGPFKWNRFAADVRIVALHGVILRRFAWVRRC